MGWNDLLHELLTSIFQNLITNNQNVSDLYQCLGVCSSWRHLAKQFLTNIAPTPWLLLAQKYPDQTTTFSTIICKFHMNHDMKSTKLSFNLIDHTMAYASYDGWLLVGYANKDFQTSTAFLYNPLSGVLLQLPPFPKHLRLDERERGNSSTIKFVTSECSPVDPNCIMCVKFPTKGNIIVLAFCKPAPSEDDCSIKGIKRCLYSSSSAYWVTMEKDSSQVEEMIFYRGKFFTIDRFAALSEYNYDVDTNVFTSNPVIVEWFNIFNNQNVATGRVSNRNYNSLVKSKSGDLLMMIKRIFNKNYSVYSDSDDNGVDRGYEGYQCCRLFAPSG